MSHGVTNAAYFCLIKHRSLWEDYLVVCPQKSNMGHSNKKGDADVTKNDIVTQQTAKIISINQHSLPNTFAMYTLASKQGSLWMSLPLLSLICRTLFLYCVAIFRVFCFCKISSYFLSEQDYDYSKIHTCYCILILKSCDCLCSLGTTVSN